MLWIAWAPPVAASTEAGVDAAVGIQAQQAAIALAALATDQRLAVWLHRNGVNSSRDQGVVEAGVDAAVGLRRGVVIARLAAHRSKAAGDQHIAVRRKVVTWVT